MKLTNWFFPLSLSCATLFLARAHGEEVAIVTGANVNVRGEPNLSGEVVTQLQSGDKVVVLNQITLEKPAAGEPSKWTRIQMPENTPVWVYTRFIETNSNTVAVGRLNLRSGPGENHNVVGRLDRGATVKPIRVVNDWMEIQTPSAAYGYVAADLLKKVEGGAAAAHPKSTNAIPAQPASTNLPPTTPPPIAPKSTNELAPEVKAIPPETQPSSTNLVSTNAFAAANLRTNAPPVAPPSPNPLADHVTETNFVSTNLSAVATPDTNAPAIAPQEQLSGLATNLTRAPATPEKLFPPKRIVRREGILRSTFNIQAPTYFELVSPETRKTINYLHTGTLGVNLKDYRGRKITVTGEEGIDKRWPNTPVIEVESLEINE